MINNRSIKQPNEFDFEKLTVFVEGTTAKNFFENFITAKFDDIAPKCDFRAFHSNQENSFTNLETALRLWWEQVEKLSPIEHVPKFVIITDADSDASTKERNTVQKVLTTKEKNSIDLVSRYEVLITPGNGSNAIEAALLRSIAPDFVSVKTCAEAFALCVAERNPKVEPFAKQNWIDKVIVYAMLAACENPEIPLWDKKGFQYWDENAPELQRIILAIRKLCA